MASSRHSGHNDDDDDFHSLSHHEPEHDGDDELDSVASDDLPPVHPVPALQHAFEESIVDATEDALNDRPAATLLNRPTAESRRQDLLERDHYDYSWNSRWKQKPSASFHPLLKLMAQIIFGMHLLQNHQAKSDAEVVKILQAHVDEIDAFLEKTTEDFDLATKDIEERITFLRLPMTHIEVFDIMLDDKKFRTQLVEGNDKIEQIIERTAKAMNAAKYDVDKGITAVQELAKYLDGVQINWPQDDVDQAAIFVAMRGNEEGWLGCLHELQMKANSLGVALVQLGTVIGEMSKLAAVASRRNKTQGHNRNSMHEAMAVPRSKYANGRRQSRQLSVVSVDKPLPQEPDFLEPAVQMTLPKTRHRHHNSVEYRTTQPTRSEHPRSLSHPSDTVPTPPRSGTQASQSGREPRDPQLQRSSETHHLATFLRHSGPLSSNPPRGTSESHASPGATNDSAYSSGSDPNVETRGQKRQSTPARFGLFPDSKPPTPRSISTTNSIRRPSHSPAVLRDTDQSQWSPAPSKRSSFSFRKILHRRSKSNLLVA